jgi:hypothetical protein
MSSSPIGRTHHASPSRRVSQRNGSGGWNGASVSVTGSPERTGQCTVTPGTVGADALYGQMGDRWLALGFQAPYK